VERAIEMASTIPAEVLNLRDRGRLAPGARADVVALDRASLTVRAVWLGGELAYGSVPSR
jgi:N-acetylglucosamine-6-phosphate deacetylase